MFFSALGVGGATLLGGLIGLCMKDLVRRWNSVILAVAAGIMLSSSMVGLILPALEYEYGGIFICTIGIVAGGLCINLIDLFLPLIVGRDDSNDRESRGKLYLFLLAIGVHNLPEGIAAGVGFGRGDVASGLLIATGIALQNIPEGAVVILPMLSAGYSPKKSLWIAALTGAVEVFGTMLGYAAVSFSDKILPFALSLAGGTMIQVISFEMMPQISSSGRKGLNSVAILLGFCLMLALSILL